MTWIDEAVTAGARKKKACEVLGLSIRTLQRWVINGETKADQRPLVERQAPSNKLSITERARVVEVCNQPE